MKVTRFNLVMSAVATKAATVTNRIARHLHRQAFGQRLPGDDLPAGAGAEHCDPALFGPGLGEKHA